MKYYPILIAILVLFIESCVNVTETDPRTGVKTSANIVLSKAGAVTVRGPIPVVGGTVPILNKKGVVTGHKTIYTAPPKDAPLALLNIFDLDQTDVAKQGIKSLRDWGLGLVAGEVTKHIDDNKTSIDQGNIDAASKATSESNLLEAQKENNRHVEAMPEEVVPTP